MGLGDARARGGETAAVVVVAVVAEVVAVAAAAVGEAGAAERAAHDVRVARVALAVRAVALVRSGARADAAVGGGSVWACGTAPVGATVGRRRGGRARDARLRRDLRPVGVGALVATGRGVVRGRRADARASRGRRGGGHALGDVHARARARERPRPRQRTSVLVALGRREMRTASWTRRAARARASSSSRADHPASSRRDSSGADPRRTLPGASLPATRDAPPLRREPESREATTGRLDA